MRNITWLAIVSVGICTGSAHAQGYPGGYNPGARPAYNPYLNLNRQGGTLIENYQGLVRPQINFQNSLQLLDAQQALSANQQQAGPQENQFLPPTGHVARFMTQSRYFLTNGTGGMGGGYGVGGGYGGGAGGIGVGGFGGAALGAQGAQVGAAAAGIRR
jgi:hypothetical protein